MFSDACKQPGRGLSQAVGIQLVQMEAQLDAFVQLESLQFPNGHTAENLRKRGFSKCEKNVGKLHLFEVIIPLVKTGMTAALQLEVLGLTMQYFNEIECGITYE